MKFLRSFRILILVALIVGMIGVVDISSTHADEPLTFSGYLGVYYTSTVHQYEDSEWYTLYVESSQPVQLTVDYFGNCSSTSASLEIFIGDQVGSIYIPPPNNYSQPFSGTATYTRTIASDSFQMGLRLTGTPHIIGTGCSLDYLLTISGASFAGYNNETLTFSDYLKVSPRDNIFEDSGLHSLHVEAGQLVELTVDYSGVNWKIGCITEAYIGSPMGRINDGMYYNGTKKFSRVMPTSANIQLGLILRVTELGHPYGGCEVYYTLTVSGASLTPINWVGPTDTEEAAGLQRIRYDQSLPVVIYVPTPVAAANGDFFIDIWRLNEGNVGLPAVNISKDALLALPEFPPENLLIASTDDDFISVYKLTTGEYQVNVGPLPDGKVHVVIFDGIPPTHTYGYTWEIENTLD